MITLSSFTKFAGITVALATALVAVPKSQAATISLNFEGIDVAGGSNNTSINNFYNGGTSGSGTSGVDYGVTFSPNASALSLNTLSNPGVSNTSRGGLGDPSSQNGGLIFLSGTQTFINYANGFDTGFSLFYAAINNPGSISVYDGLNGTGGLLATLGLPITTGSCPGYNAGFCPFAPVGVSFAGTARSIGFAGVANQIVLDDVTFGSVTPGAPTTAVPEPFTIVGTLIGATAAYRTRKRLKATNKL
ncbi:hypothetical protein [Chamaesiphon sp. OTE_8_metabat_110]|uniref:hypothetical protein n=1 Tax=Chamaesiphon sp. OTE_8_metabat_110 TaxID=2964696 RepID=UPI00286B9985|nr:hypothetical protein [Chamaesiphon sp. OTE_8_metabat_110]